MISKANDIWIFNRTENNVLNDLGKLLCNTSIELTRIWVDDDNSDLGCVNYVSTLYMYTSSS